MNKDVNNISPEQCCSACGVKIDAQGNVHFSVGKPGSRERLYARVCQYAKRDGCINNDVDKLSPITPQDQYGLQAFPPDQLDAIFAGLPAIDFNQL